jgi:hypothetical protein
MVGLPHSAGGFPSPVCRVALGEARLRRLVSANFEIARLDHFEWDPRVAHVVTDQVVVALGQISAGGLIRGPVESEVFPFASGVIADWIFLV